MAGNRTLVVLFLCLQAAISACLSLPGRISRELNLDSTTWELHEIGESQPIPGTSITMSLEGGRIQGNAGCNDYYGTFELSNEQSGSMPTGDFRITRLVVNEMVCATPEGVMEQEDAYLQHLLDVVKVWRGPEQYYCLLGMKDAGGQMILGFQED